MLSNGFVVLIGMGTVFLGLIGLVLFCELMSFAVRKLEGTDVEKKESKKDEKADRTGEQSQKNQDDVVMLLTVVMAEELGVAPSEISVKLVG